MLNPYMKGDLVSFRTAVREWDIRHLRWVNFYDFSQVDGVVYEVGQHTVTVQVGDALIAVPYTNIVD